MTKLSTGRKEVSENGEKLWKNFEVRTQCLSSKKPFLRFPRALIDYHEGRPVDAYALRP